MSFEEPGALNFEEEGDLGSITKQTRGAHTLPEINTALFTAPIEVEDLADIVHHPPALRSKSITTITTPNTYKNKIRRNTLLSETSLSAKPSSRNYIPPQKKLGSLSSISPTAVKTQQIDIRTADQTRFKKLAQKLNTISSETQIDKTDSESWNILLSSSRIAFANTE